MGSEAHVNTCYKHFYYFVKEFNLIDNKELEPLVSVGLGAAFAGIPLWKPWFRYLMSGIWERWRAPPPELLKSMAQFHSEPVGFGNL